MSRPDTVDRTFCFAVAIIRFCQVLNRSPGAARTLGTQLLRTGTSIGANVEEAQAGQSRRDFISKNQIALKEARETRYWLRLIAESELSTDPRIRELIQEAFELTKILGAIVVTARTNLDSRS